jgi:hypothetical protein
MMDSGRTIRLTVMENSFMQMEMSMTDSGKMIKLMVWVTTSMQMERPTMGSGKMTSNMEMEQKLGRMGPGMKAAISKGRNMERELYALQMEASIQETFSTMRYQVGENMCGLMANPMKDSGKKIRCMGTAYWRGKMERDTKGTLSMTREKVRGSSIGKMEEYMMGNGKMGSSTEEACSLLRMESKGWGSGIEEERQSGLHDVPCSLNLYIYFIIFAI